MPHYGGLDRKNWDAMILPRSQTLATVLPTAVPILTRMAHKNVAQRAARSKESTPMNTGTQVKNLNPKDILSDKDGGSGTSQPDGGDAGSDKPTSGSGGHEQ